MDRTTRRLFLAALVVVVAIGVALTLLGGGTPGDGPSPRLTPPAAPTVDGVVVKVDSVGLGNVSGFSLRTDDGRTIQFTLGRLGNGTVFAPGHLPEHQATSQRIRVWYADPGNGTLDALWLDDAPAR